MAENIKNQARVVLGIETSCDETGVALYDPALGIIAEALHSQATQHGHYGGVVPEIAARDHLRRLLPMVKNILLSAQCTPKDLQGIAYTRGPGLIGALMVGTSFARSLAYAWDLPCLGVHHLEAHLLAAQLEADAPDPPFLSLLVSGGHTMLVVVEAIGCYRILGQSLDDAAGEAFDKAAKILGLGYPGGPVLARLAEQGNPQRFHFPRPMVAKKGLDFSFSGLKTSLWNTVRKLGELNQQTRADLAASFECAIIDTLVIKALRAQEVTGLKNLVVAGGVAANRNLRKQLSATNPGIQVSFPDVRWCTDNGAMVAHAGYHRINAGQKDDSLAIDPLARWRLDHVMPLAGLPSILAQDA